MAIRSRFGPESSNLAAAPIIYHLEASTDDEPDLVTAFFRDPVETLGGEFGDHGFDSGEDWTVHTQVIDHHLFHLGWIWTMTAVVIPEHKQIVVTAIKHPRPADSDD